MGRIPLTRLLVAALAATGLLFTWSGGDPYLDLEAWKEQQAQAATVGVPDLSGPAPEPQEQVAPEPTQIPTSPPPSTTPQPSATPTNDTGEMAIDCDTGTAGVQPSCSYDADESFEIHVIVNAAPPGGFVAFQTKLQWQDSTLDYLPQPLASEILWEACSLPVRRDGQPSEAGIAHGCSITPIPSQGDAFTGPLLSIQMQCQGDGDTTIELLPRRDEAQDGTGFRLADAQEVVPALMAGHIRCGFGSPPTPTPSAEPTPDIPPPPPDDLPHAKPETRVEREIPVGGGRIESADGRVTIDFPPEAATERLNVRITHKSPADLQPVPHHPVVSAWELEAFALDRDSAPVHEFLANVRITVTYTMDDLLGRDPDTLRLWTWNEETSQWEELPQERVPNSGTVITEVNHFSIDVGTADPAVISAPFLRSFQTDLQTGASQVSLPLDVPAGRGGLAPSLMLTYSSNRVNEMKSELAQGSWMGIGWDLNTGAVRTVFPEFAGDEERYFLELNGAGDEMILGTDGYWRTERHEFLRIRLLNSSSQMVTTTTGAKDCARFDPAIKQPCYWEVTDKSGTKYYFGGWSAVGPEANASRYYTYWLGGSTWKRFYYQWDIRAVSDTHLNLIYYGYQQQTLPDCPTTPCHPYVFSSYPDFIAYNFNGPVPATVVSFTLRPETTHDGQPPIPLREDAPYNVDVGPPGCGRYEVGTHMDPPNSWGSKVEETRVLDTITVSSNGQIRKGYKFAYSETPFQTATYPTCYVSGETRLTSSKVLDRNLNDGTTETTSPLQTMTFQYVNRSFSFPSETPITQPFLDTAGTLEFGGTIDYDYILTISSGHWSRQVVSQRKLMAGVVGGPEDMVTTYDYSGSPQYFVPPGSTNKEAEYRGFGNVTETRDPNAIFGTFTIHDYITTGTPTDEFLSGRETRTRIYGPNLQLWRDINYSYALQPLNPCFGGCATQFIKLTSIVTKIASYNASGEPLPLTNLETQYDYDDFGNVVYQRQYGIAGDEPRTIYRPHSTPPTDAAQWATHKWIMLPKVDNLYSGSHSAPPPTTSLVVGTALYYDNSADALFGAPPTKGELTRVERTNDGTPELSSNVYYTYDSATGNKTAESIRTATQQGTMPNVPRTTWSYDDVLKTMVDQIAQPNTNPATPTLPGFTTTLELDLRMGLVTDRHEPSGNDVTFTYDRFGRLETVRDDFTQAGDPLVEHVYEWDRWPANLNRTITYNRFDSGGLATTNIQCIDGFGRVVQTRQSHTSANDSVVQTGYNARGLTSYVTAPFEDSDSDTQRCDALVSVAAKPRTESFYNPLDEASFTKINPGLADQACSRMERNGFTTNVTDANGHRETYNYDGYWRLDSVGEVPGSMTDPCSGNPLEGFGTPALTRYDYDAADRLTKVTDADGNITRMFYDGLGRKVRMVDPDMGEWIYAYDIAGNLTEQRDARRLFVSMLYDPLNRVTRKCYVPNSSCAAQTQAPGLAATYTYDTYNSSACSGLSLAGSGATGQLTALTTKRVSPATDTVSQWCFDERGRERRERLTVDGSNYDVSQTYNDADDLDTVTYPDGEAVATAYDSISGLPEHLDSPLADYVNDATYNEAFQMLTMTLETGGTDQSVAYAYDEDGRGWLEQVRYPSLGTATLDLRYEQYDKVGNLKQTYDATGNQRQDFIYDDRDRLDLALPDGTFGYVADYAYTGIGNMALINETGSPWYLDYGPTVASIQLLPGRHLAHAAMIVDNAAPATSGSAVRAYQFDANGNVTGISTTNASTIDSDADGCTNAEERGPASPACGGRDPTNFWDNYDVAAGTDTSVGQKNGTIDLFNDVTAVANSYSASDNGGQAAINRSSDPLTTPYQGPGTYHPLLDRSGSDGKGPPDGTIDLFNDILGASAQFGNRVSVPVQPEIQFVYDNENRLVQRTAGGTTTTYSYDAQGRLVQRKVGSTTTVYAGGIYEKTGNTVVDYYFFDGRRVAMRKTGPGVRYLLGDHLGSTSVILDPNGGGSVATQRYYPYGRTRSGDVSSITDKQFTGHQKEAADLYFMQARFYDPFVGRFLQADSIVPDLMNPQALNRYSYVMGNPLRYADPTGSVPTVPPTSSGCFGLGNDCGDPDEYSGCTPSHPAVATCQEAGQILAYQAIADDLPSDGQCSALCLTELVASVVPGTSDVIDFCTVVTGRVYCFRGDEVGLGWRAVSLGSLVNPWFGFGRPVRTASGAIEESARIGRAGESVFKVDHRRFISLSGSAHFRVADIFLAGKAVVEIKNVKYVPWSSQIDDYIRFAKSQDIQFHLVVDANTTISKRVDASIQSGDIILHRVVLPK